MDQVRVRPYALEELTDRALVAGMFAVTAGLVPAVVLECAYFLLDKDPGICGQVAFAAGTLFGWKVAVDAMVDEVVQNYRAWKEQNPGKSYLLEVVFSDCYA